MTDDVGLRRQQQQQQANSVIAGGGGGDVNNKSSTVYERIDDCLITSIVSEEDPLTDSDQAKQGLLPKPYASSMKPGTKPKPSTHQRTPPPLPPRTEQSMTPPLFAPSSSTAGRRTTGSKHGKSSSSSATPPSIYSASTCGSSGTFMAPNLAGVHANSGSLLITAENSSTGSSSGDGHHHGPPTRIGHHRLQNIPGRSASHSPAGGDSSSAHSSSTAEGGYLMRTDSGNLFISPPQPELVGAMADSPETMRTSVGGGIGSSGIADITAHGLFGTTMSHDSAVATTNTTGGGTMSSRTKLRRATTAGPAGNNGSNGTKFQEKMFENVPIRLANIQMNYDPATGVTRPLLYHTDFRSYSALLSKVTRRLRCPSWRCFAIVLLILLFLSLVGIGFLIVKFVLPYFGFLTTPPCENQKSPNFAALSSVAGGRPAAVPFTVDLSSAPAGVSFQMGAPNFVAIDILKGAAYGLVGVYGRRFAPPTRYRFDFFKLIDNSVLSSTFSTGQSVIYRLDNSTVGFVEYLEPGQWFLLFSNDDEYVSSKIGKEADADQPPPMTSKVNSLDVAVFLHGPLATGCPADCHGRGFCATGSGGKHCQCKSDFTGPDCSMPICPIVCSGRGRLVAGPKCLCDVGWKGSDCQVSQSTCEDPTCSGHGQCDGGACKCQSGFSGNNCEKASCIGGCSSHGVCVDGKCYCEQNFTGPTCSIPFSVFKNNTTAGKLPDSSGIIIEPVLPDVDALLCKTRCKYGTCVGERQNVCLCFYGYNGRFCTFEGCPKNCSGHGKCSTVSLVGSAQHYACHCETGWKDADCGTMREKCSGGVDEDGDSLVDCADPDCCTKGLCSQSPACATVPNPILELLSRQGLPPNSPFADRVSFLLGGVQRGIQQSSSGGNVMVWLDQKRVSVVAGNVLLAKDRSHLVGVKVSQMAVGTSASTVHLGYTLSREQGGAFDLLVEGGGVVWLRFEHSSKNLCPQDIALNVGWNEFKMLDSPILIEAAQKNGSCGRIDIEKTCSAIVHDHAKISPSVFTSWQAVQSGAVGAAFPFGSTVVPELNDPIETLPIGDTEFSLYWLGTFARNRHANVVVRMTPEDPTLLPDELSFVKLQITVEGVVEERLFEAEPDLKYTFSWSGKNRFNWESAGVVQATIRIGYVYSNCTSNPIWVTRKARLLSPVCAPVAPPFAGWFLSGQHHFDPQNSILYRSDGSVRLFSENLFLRRVIGQPGRRRALTSCTNCNGNPECRCEGPVDSVRLSRPRDLAADRSGNLIILDDNAILKIVNAPQSSEAKLLYDLQLDVGIGSSTAEMDLVAIAVHPTEEAVYLADKRGRRIYRVNWPSTVANAKRQRGLQLVTGSPTGQICSAPEQQNSCGDGLAAAEALLIQPKSLAFDKFGNLFVADGHVVRRISNDSKTIESYVGSLSYERDDGQSSRCWKQPVHRKNGDQLIDWPIAVAVNPFDDSLYVVDINNVIYQVTADDQVIVVAGRSPNCQPITGKPELAPENFRFRNIKDIFFSLNGDLFILQSKPAEILVLTADRLQVKPLTGHRCSGPGRSSCLTAFNRTTLATASPSAADLTFNEPAAILALPNGAIYVADSSDNAVYTLEQNLPTPLSSSEGNWRHYDIYDPDLDQIHRFDLVGNHKMTVAASSGVTLLTFSYHSEGMLQAPLSKVANPQTGYELTFTRNFVENSYSSVISSNIGGHQFSARVADSSTPMDVFIDANNRTTLFTYTPESLLLRSVHRPDGQWVLYDYDSNTRLIRAASSGATRLISVEPKISQNNGVMTLVKSPSLPDAETTYSSVGDEVSVDSKSDGDRTVRKFNRIAPSVWLITSRDNSGAMNQLTLVDSRSSSTTGLDGRNWVAVNGNMSVEWRRTSPPSSAVSSTMPLASVGQLLRQLRVTESRALKVTTTITRGNSMQLRGHRNISGDRGLADADRRGSVFAMPAPRLISVVDDETVVGSVAQTIVLIAHLNRTAQPQRETFFNLQTPVLNASLQQQAAVQLLYVTYDDADRPLQLKPSHHKFPAVRLGYIANSRRGNLGSIKFGDVESTWQPDQRGLLKLRSFADGRAFEFAYLGNTSLLQSVSLVGGKELASLRYEAATNGLEAIYSSKLTQNAPKYRFRAIQGLEFSRRILTLPGFFSSAGVKTDLDIVLDRGLGFTRAFTVGSSDSSSTAVFSPDSGLLRKVQFSNGELSIKSAELSFDQAVSSYKDYERKVSLSSLKSSGKLIGAQFSVNSKTILTLLRNSTTIEIALPEKGTTLRARIAPPVESGTLKVIEFGKFEKVLIGNWTLLCELDSLGRLVHVTVYEPNSRKPLLQSTTFYEIVHHDEVDSPARSPWRIARSVWHVLASNEIYAHIYEWTPVIEGSLLKSIKVERSIQNSKPHSFGTSVGFTWSTPGGNLMEATSATFETKDDNGEFSTQKPLNFAFKTGAQDQILSLTGAGSSSSSNVVYDSNGCISQLGGRTFVFNSLRQLVQVSEGDSVKLSYDAYGRIAQVIDKDSNLALVYNDRSPAAKLLISGDVKSGQFRIYHYSAVTGCLVGIQEGLDGPMVVVMTDAWCSPVIGLKADGSRTLFPRLSGSASFAGQPSVPSASNTDLPIGFHGFVHLQKSGVVFIDNVRPLDTVSGRFLCPDFASLLADSSTNELSGLSLGRDISIGMSRHAPFNLFQFVGPDSSRTNFHLLNVDHPSADNFAGDAKAWLSKILAPVSLSPMSDEAFLLQQEPITELTNGQVMSTLANHYARTFGIVSRAEMASALKISILSSLSASSSLDNRNKNWPVFVAPPSMTPIFAHPALSRVSLSAAFAYGNDRQQVYELIVSGKVTSQVSQYQSLLRLITVILNGTLYTAQTTHSDQTRFVPDLLQYNLVKANQSVTLQSDLSLLGSGHQVTCTDRVSFGDSFDVAADCSRNVFVLRSSPNHVFTVHYGVNIRERYFLGDQQFFK